MKRLFSFILLGCLEVLLPLTSWAQADKALMDKAQKGDTKAMVRLAQCYENGAGVQMDSAVALSWYQKAAALGSGDAWIHISSYYLKGRGVEKDTARSLAIRKEWADKGLPLALSALASSYKNGYGVPVDTARVLALYQQAAKKGDGNALVFMGDMYCFGRYGAKKDEAKGLDYWKKAFKAGDYFAASRLFDYYAEKQDYVSGRAYLEEGLRWNEPGCIFSKAEMYYKGLGVPVDERKAQQIMSDYISIQSDVDYAYYLAGLMYMAVDDINLRDSALAMQYWKKGDALGSQLCRMMIASTMMNSGHYVEAQEWLQKILANPKDNDMKGNACLEMSRCAYMGLGMPQDYDNAIQWLERGANQYNNGDCAMTLAALYDDEDYLAGGGDPKLSPYWYRKAHDLGNKDALFELARCYVGRNQLDDAKSVVQELIDGGDTKGYLYMAQILVQQGDNKQALAMLNKGDKKGDSECREVLGKLYEDGSELTAQDFKKAAKYYEKAASASSYYQLGTMYLSGKLGSRSEKDIAKGLELYNKSADMGYTDAIYKLGYFYENGEYVGGVDHQKAVGYFKLLADNNIPSGLFKMGLYYELGDGGIEKDSVKCIEYYNRAAELGDGDAMCYLGDFHRIGQFLPLDKEKAFEYYLMADEAGVGMGTYYVARSYMEGCGVAVDTVAAVPYLRRAAADGIGKAAYLLGKFFEEGIGGLTQNVDSAFTYYLVGHQNGSGDASYILGKNLYEEGAYSQAFNCVYSAAQRGNVDGVVLLALFLQEGVGTEPDPEQAYRLLEMVANRTDDSRAYSYMGLARLQGNGCVQNEVLGKQYLDTAAAMGDATGMYYLGLCHLNGYGCEPDSLEGVKWIAASADNKYIKAAVTMGDLLSDQEDYEKAVGYYETAAAAGNNNGICKLGYCYEKGYGVKLSFKKAYDLYLQAAENGSTLGCKMVANCYQEGIYVEEDALKSFEWLKKAAELGSADAMYMVASILEIGDEGIKKDIKKAKEWYSKSAKAGYEPAQAALNRLK